MPATLTATLSDLPLVWPSTAMDRIGEAFWSPFVRLFRRRHPTGLLRDSSGRITGIWRVDVGGDWPSNLLWCRRTPDGLAHFRAYLPQGIDAKAIEQAAQRLNKGDEDFERRRRWPAANHMAGLGIPDDELLRIACMQLAREDAKLTRYPLSPGPIALRGCFEHLKVPVQAFRATLDPQALAIASIAAPIRGTRGFERRLVARWSGLDSTFSPGAPLRHAIYEFPEHADVLGRLWAEKPAEFPSGNSRLAAIAALASFPATPQEEKRPPDVKFRLLPWSFATTSKAMAARIVDGSEAFRVALAEVEPDAAPIRNPFEPLEGEVFEGEVFDARSSLRDACIYVLRRLPVDWAPKNLDEWRVLARTARGLMVAGNDRPRGLAFHDFLDVRGRWVEFSRRIERAIGLAPGADLNLVQRVRDLSDPVQRLAAEVVVPARELLGMETFDDPFKPYSPQAMAVMNLLYGRKTLAGCLELSREWHARRGAMNSAMADAAPAPDVRWSPGLPDATIGDFDFKVLASARDLADEGRNGVNADGTQGLHHCSAGYVAECALGASRIVSIRMRAEDAPFARISSAEVRFDIDIETGKPIAQLGQHRGIFNQRAPDEAHDAMVAYMREHGRNISARDLGVVPTPGFPEGVIAAGYDYRLENAWAVARDAWAPFLPRSLRGKDMKAFATLTE